MAFVPDGEGSGWFLTLVVQDRNGDESRLEYSLRAATEPAATAAVATITAAFQAVSDAIVVKRHMSFRTVEDAFAYPVVGEVQTRARIVYQIVDEVTKETFDIPAPKEAIFRALIGPQNKVVDIADLDVIAYANLFKTTGEAFISDGESLDFLINGRKASTKS